MNMKELTHSVMLENKDTNYTELDDESVLNVVFGYVQVNVPIPDGLVKVCKTRNIWQHIKPILGERQDVEEIMDEIETGLY